MGMSKRLMAVILSLSMLMATVAFSATPMPSEGLRSPDVATMKSAEQLTNTQATPAKPAAAEAQPGATQPAATSPSSPNQVAAAPAAKAMPAQPQVDPNIQSAPVGRVVWVKGVFKAISMGNKERALDRASIIYLHDTLITDTNSQAQIVFTDNSLMTFKPNTRFEIAQYSYTPENKKGVGKYIMNLIEGGFRTITGLIAKGDPNAYQVNTPVATIGVRGTDYAVYVSGGQLYVGYYKGKPCVKNGSGTLCLDDKNKYAEVKKPGAQPQAVSKQPAVFKEKLAVVPASIAPSSDNSFGPLMSGSDNTSGSSGASGSGSGGGGGGGTSSGSSGGTLESTSSSSGTSSSDTTTSGTSSSSSSGSSESVSVGSTSSDSGNITITNTEIQVTAPPPPPSGTVSSFCITY